MLENVKLISVTKPINIEGASSGDDLIAFCARVSNPNNQTNFDTVARLMSYCVKNKHWSIFEMAGMCVEITTSRAIAQQILRHRSFSFQEFSQRYATVQEFVTYEARRQDLKNRQNSVDNMAKKDKEWFEKAQAKVIETSCMFYEEALERGIAKEQARFLLPLNTKTVLYMNGNVRSWIHYIQLRTENGTQKEHSVIANNIKVIFSEQFPLVAKALEWI
jgi:thymidylate synthase (FAD)